MLEHRRSELFTPSFSPAKVRWWHESIEGARWDGGSHAHFEVLCQMIGGRSVEETVALSYCYDRVVNDGARSSSGRWCICLSEVPPCPAEARGSIGSDGFSALLTVKADLERAADHLPIGWTSTQRIYETQGRERVYRQRLTYYRRNLGVRDADRWLEPRDPETRRPASRALAHFMMAVFLGHPTTCRWPRAGSLIERDVFTALAHPLKEAA